jgi:hypothetical protein
MTADNAVGSWSDLDLSMINADLEDFGPELDVDLLGLKDFTIEPLERLEDANKEIDLDNFGNDLTHQCPKCGFEFND